MAEVEGGGGRFRQLPRGVMQLETALLSALTLLGAVWALDVPFLFDIALYREQFVGIVFFFGMPAIFIGVRVTQRSTENHVPWFDWIFAILSAAAGGYITIYYQDIVETTEAITPVRLVLGAAAVLLTLEATRRLTGWALTSLAIAFLAYAKFSYLLPGALGLPSADWDRLTIYLYADGNALFGLPLGVVTTIIIAFIIFGRILFALGGDRFLTDLAIATMGRYRGASAKTAVAASTLFGTISGSVVSNVVMDGPITIPMMRKGGYPAPTAAAIEAVASTGGQIMPPVMGITAFLMAEYLNVSYASIVSAALIPALLYYLSVFVQVDLEAGRLRLKPFQGGALPPMRDVLVRGMPFGIAIVVLLWLLVFQNWQPAKSAMAAAILAVVVSFLRRETRPSLAGLVRVFPETGRIILDLVALAASAGLVLGALAISGLGFQFVLMLVDIAEGSLFALLLMTAAVCMVLGMGMPSTIIYVMLAVLVAPAFENFGIPTIAAHMFLFYFGMLSMITPPVCFATFAAAAIAETNFWQAGWVGVRLGVIAYVVPFVFAFQPELLMVGSVTGIIVATLVTGVGVVMVSVAVVGFLFRDMGWPTRIGCLAAGVLLFIPRDGDLLFFNIAGFALTAGIVGWEWWAAKKTAAPEPT